ncbi:MAG: tetratricopeptide repeat protein [Candidatus Binatia bacterium]
MNTLRPIVPASASNPKHRAVSRDGGAVLLAFLCLGALTIAAPAARASDSPPPAAAAQPAAAQPAAAVNSTVAERLLLANNYLEKGRFDDALDTVDELTHLRKLKPVDHAQIHRFRGYILIAKGDTDGGGREFEAALAQNALEESARQGMIYTLAQIHTQAGKFDKARELLDRWFATAVDPKPEAFFLKAMILVQQEDFRGALEPARTAVARSPQPRESWLQLLASVQFQLQDYANLADTLRQLVAAAPGNKRYWVQLATVENSLGKDESALATLGVAHVGGLLNDDREYRQHARLCFVREMPQDCAATLEEGMAAGIVKRDAEAYRLLANCYIAARENERALGPLAKAGELSEDANSFLLLGQLELQKERFASARDALGKAKAKAKPEQKGSIELLIGVAELGSGRFDDAERAFRVAQVDEKTRSAADSYLKHLEQKRALRDLLQEPAAVAAEGGGEPVSDAGALGNASRL